VNEVDQSEKSSSNKHKLIKNETINNFELENSGIGSSSSSEYNIWKQSDEKVSVQS
jgi:hypothetical protein